MRKTHNVNTNFVTYIVQILNNSGMSDIWIKQLANQEHNKPKKPLIQRIQCRLKDISAQSILTQLQNPNSGKLKFLNSLKDIYGQETYLKIQKLSNRRAITKLRTSNHNLAIESGRWTNTERKHRLCTQCTLSKIEDEMHFIFDCPKYSDIRKTTFTPINDNVGINLNNEYNRINNQKTLFTSDNLSALNTFGKYVKKAFEMRTT